MKLLFYVDFFTTLKKIRDIEMTTFFQDFQLSDFSDQYCFYISGRNIVFIAFLLIYQLIND